MSTKPGNAEKVAAIKAILEAAKTELNLIEQICLKDTDIGKNEEVIRAKENLCCLMAPPSSVPKRSDDAPSGGITQEQLDAAEAAQAEAEKEAAKAKAAAEKAASEAKAAAAKAEAEIAKAKADAAAAIAAAGGDQAAKDTAQTDLDEAIKAAVEAAKAEAQVEIDAAIARAEAAEAAATPVVDEKLKKAGIEAAKLLISEKNSNKTGGEAKSKDIKIINYNTKFGSNPQVTQIMVDTIQKAINPDWKANILQNGMVIFTKATETQWEIPSKPANGKGPKSTPIITSGPAQPAAGLAAEAATVAAAMKARRAAAGEPTGEPTGESAEELTEAEAEATTAATTAARPVGRSKGAQPAASPAGAAGAAAGRTKGVQPAAPPAGAAGASTGATSTGPRTVQVPNSELKRRAAAAAGQPKGVQPAAPPAGAAGAAGAAAAAAPTGAQTAPLSTKEKTQQQTDAIVQKSRGTGGTAVSKPKGITGGLRRSKRKDTT
jgi:colicin import membrane protein